ncbi:MAG: hypothetical protein BGO78_16595 [Chloroflexi bacterium 44-23]|nr:MAG: hypothetical protein BGO78_16595 [Chloroflexi bacterium 44-23]
MPEIFFVIPPGLEAIAAREALDTLTLYSDKLAKEGLSSFPEIKCSWNFIHIANRELRVPTRILVRLGNFRATNFAELVKKAARITWSDFLSKNSTITIRTTCKKSKLYHSDAVTERVHKAIEMQMQQKINLAKHKEEDEPSPIDQLILVRLVDDEVEISIDSSGEPLYKRGYRLASAKAPIRENLAAAVLLASGWKYDQPLIDPFCGSGTFPIEAALLQNKIPPGANRSFAYQNWPVFQKQLKFLPANLPLSGPKVPARNNIYGSDRDQGAVQAAIENGKRAGVEKYIQWNWHAFSDLPLYEQPGWIITNPPYGQRISSNKDLRNLYAQFGKIVLNNFKDWQIVFLCSDIKLATQTQLKLKPLLKFSNGGIRVTAYSARV